MGMGNKRCYLASANTSEGFVSFFDYVLKDAERVYIIKGGPGCGKSTFIKRIGEDLLKEGFDLDLIYCSADSDSLDGIYIRDTNTAIVDGTAPHVIDPKYPGAIEKILNFGEYWDMDYLRENKDKIKNITDEISAEYEKLYGHLKDAKAVHDRWEKEYIIGMNFNKAQEITEDLISEIVKDKANKKAKEWHRFSGAMTPQGNINFYDILTDRIENKYVVKGRPGSGKSTMTRKIAKALMDSGYDVEFYHCAFDPSSIDMIIVPELSFALLDGTAPHVFDPGKGDKLVDMFTCIDTNVVHEKENPIKSIEIEYSDEISKAKKVYSKIKDLHDELEKIYVKATNFNCVNALRTEIMREIKGL